jgi:heme-degrading monooxygenase HmoA
VIVRVLTARVRPKRVALFNAQMRHALAELKEQDGLVYAKLARRFVDDGEEVMLVEEWASPADLYRWTGGALATPRLAPGAEDLIDDLRIVHYEALDRTPDEGGLETVEGAPDADRPGEPAERETSGP